MNPVFISYRRDDAEGQAGRLYDDLITAFGPNSVFMDVAAIEPGRDFRKAIDQSLSSCGSFLSVIGRNWLNAKDASGQRRLDDSADFVRLETASALKRDIPVMPVLVQGASMPRSDQLPDDLKDLAYRNAIELTHPRWESDVQLLIKALRPYVSQTPQQAGEVPTQRMDDGAQSNRQNARALPTGGNRIAKALRSARLAVFLAVIFLTAVGVAWYRTRLPKIVVPDLQGKTLDSARAVLNAGHLALGNTEQKEVAGVTPGSIVAQSVAAGEQASTGTSISVTVAAAPKLASHPTPAKPAAPRRIAVPDLQGKTLAEARAILDAKHLALGDTERREEAGVPPGTIVAQSVAAGGLAPVGTSINATVAVAPKSPCRVRDVFLVGRGSSPTDALAKVRIDGFGAALAGQEVTVMLDFMSEAGNYLLERRLQTYAQNTIVDVSSGSNVNAGGVKREDIKDVRTIQVIIWRGWMSKVGKQEVFCKSEVPARFE